jgi:hypothetical protein
MIEHRIKNIEEQITLAGLLPGVDLSCLPLEESAKLKRVVLDLYRLIHASGFNAGADYAMNAIVGDIESIPGMRFSIDEHHASSLAEIAPVVEPFSVSGSGEKSAPKQTPSVSHNNKPANPSKRGAKAPTEGKLKKARPRIQKRRARSTSLTGYHWRKEGARGELRKDFYVEEDEVRKQKPP